jgi:hypothetical protein
VHVVLNADNEIGPKKGIAPPPRGAVTTFVALFAMNMLDYLDRNLLMSMQPQIKGELPGRHLVALAHRQSVGPVRRPGDDGRRARPDLELDRRRGDAGRRSSAREYCRRSARGRAGAFDIRDRPPGRSAILAP